MKRFILALVVLTACDYSDRPCDFSAADICFTSDTPINKARVEYMVELLDSELDRLYPDRENMSQVLSYAGVSVKYIDGNLVYGCRPLYEGDTTIMVSGVSPYICDGEMSGINKSGSIIDIEKDHKCVLIHELLHTWETYGLGITPPQDHTTEHLFERVYGGWSVEYFVEVKVGQEYGCQ